jgi:hypothetical protein
MMHVADGTFSCGARTAASIWLTAIPGSSQIDRLLLRMSPFLMLWTGAPGDRQKVDGGSPSR